MAHAIPDRLVVLFFLNSFLGVKFLFVFNSLLDVSFESSQMIEESVLVS